MTQQEAQALYAVLLRLADPEQTLTPSERRDILNQIVRARCEQNVEDILAATANQRKLRIKRGTTAENDAYTGLSGEITLDTDENTLRVHDGETPGGHLVSAGGGGATTLPENMDYVVESQMPTAENDYTWYRKYASGWVEQGGYSKAQTITLLVPMQDANYSVLLTGGCEITNNNVTVYGFRNRTKINFVVQGNILNSSGASSNANGGYKMWVARGIAE